MSRRPTYPSCASASSWFRPPQDGEASAPRPSRFTSNRSVARSTTRRASRPLNSRERALCHQRTLPSQGFSPSTACPVRVPSRCWLIRLAPIHLDPPWPLTKPVRVSSHRDDPLPFSLGSRSGRRLAQGVSSRPTKMTLFGAGSPVNASVARARTSPHASRDLRNLRAFREQRFSSHRSHRRCGQEREATAARLRGGEEHPHRRGKRLRGCG